MMEYAERYKFASSGLVKIDDMVFCLDAAAFRKEIDPWPTGLWVLAEQFKCPRNRRLVGLRLLLSQVCQVNSEMLSKSSSASRVNRMTGLRADIGLRFLSLAKPSPSPAVDVLQQLRRELHELAPLGLL